MAKRAAKSGDVKQLTFEQSLEELEAIVEAMEEGEVPLDKSVAQYERGVALIKRCRGLLGEAEKKIELLAEDESGNPVTEAMDGDEE